MDMLRRNGCMRRRIIYAAIYGEPMDRGDIDMLSSERYIVAIFGDTCNSFRLSGLYNHRGERKLVACIIVLYTYRYSIISRG